MGSPLGPLYADFYMCSIENKVIPTLDDIKMYRRYVDDSFLICTTDKVCEIIKAFEDNSKLKFTSECENNSCISFLDVKVVRESSVYRKPTNSGACLDYNSFGPDVYKRSVILSYVNRAYRLSSSWKEFDAEINEIKQILINNNYPNALVDSVIQKYLKRKMKQPIMLQFQSTRNINYFFKSQWSSAAKTEEKRLNVIISEHVKGRVEESQVKLRVYYQSKKLVNMLKHQTKRQISDEHHVVYQYQYPHSSCNGANYIGFTTCTLMQRCQQHVSNGAIKQHLLSHPQVNKGYKSILQNMKIITRFQKQKDLELAEAIIIKNQQPPLNKQDQGLTRRLILL